jgi:hypothetical protein
MEPWTVFARDSVKMFQNMQKKGAKVLPDRLKESDPVTSMFTIISYTVSS